MKIVKRLACLLLVAVLLVPLMPVAKAADTKLVALTFDDGPGPYTEKLLNGLEEKNVKATFFCLGSRAERYPDLIRRMVADGHQVANHSYDHPNLNELSIDNAVWQIQKTDDILNGILGSNEHFFIRPPYGNTTQDIRNELLAPAIIWSVDTIDWQLLNSTAVKDKILSDTFDGSIVLMHDIHATTVDGILAALDTLIDRGYEFVTVKELMRLRGVTPGAGQLYYRVNPTGIDSVISDAPVATVSREEESLQISLVSTDGAPIYYTLDGSDPTYDSPVYQEPFTVELPCSVRAVSAWDLNGDRSNMLEKDYTLPPASAPIISAENGKLMITPANPEEYIMVCPEPETDYQQFNGSNVQNNTWFSCYADGEGLARSEITRLLFTQEGNLASDLDSAAWFYPAMDHCITKGYFHGSGSWEYNPQGILTRAMTVVLLHRYAGGETAEIENTFSDVTEQDYFYDAVRWAFEKGIVNGTGNQLFSPHRPVTRQEMAKMLTVFLNLESVEIEVEYEDISQVSEWAVQSVLAVTGEGLMCGSGGFFRPLASITRAEAAEILKRLGQ